MELSSRDPENNPINNLPLETQLFYQNTKNQIDNMSFDQLKSFTDLLFTSYIMQQTYIKDILKQQILSDDIYTSN